MTVSRKTTFVIILCLVLFSISLPVLAAPWFWPIVPCGLNDPGPNDPDRLDPSYYQPCNQCDLFRLLKNLIDFIFFVFVPLIGTLLFVWAGFLILLAGGNPKLYGQGISIFKNTFIAIGIIMLSWLITNTIIKTLAADSDLSDRWYKFECVAKVDGEEEPPDKPPLDAVKYDCNENDECVRNPNGRFTTPLCNGFCAPPAAKKYSCQNNQCTEDPNGSYTEPTCNNQCQPAPEASLIITTTSLADAKVNTAYSQSLSARGGEPPYLWSVTQGGLPPGVSINGAAGVISGKPTTGGPFSFTVIVKDSSSPEKSASKQLTLQVTSGTAVTQCGDFDLVCSNTARSCPGITRDPALPSGRSDWRYLIPEVAAQHPIPGVDTVKLLEAIMRIETNGVMDKASSSVPSSCGLMQFQENTANRFRSFCGVNHPVSCDWLRGKADALQAGETKESVAKASICMSAEYFKSIRNGRDYKGDVTDLPAAYNGGEGAIATSRDCSSQSTANPKYDRDCRNRPTLSYECLWDDLAHTKCNSGPSSYEQTRDYVAKFNTCYFR